MLSSESRVTMVYTPLWLLVAVLPALLHSAHAAYRNCGGAVKYTSVSVSGCDDGSKVCVLKRGDKATLSASFTPDKDYDKVLVKVYGQMVPMPPIPFPYPEADGCQNSGLQCPLKAGQESVYNTTLEISKAFPKVKKLKVQFQLWDEDEIVCFEFDATLE